MKRFFRKYAAALAFCGIALAGSVAIGTSARQGELTLYHSQLRSCAYQNRHLHELNLRVETNVLQRDVLLQLITAAREARLASYHQNHHESDLRAAQKYSRLVSTVNTTINYRTLPYIDCNQTIKHP